MTTKVSKKRVLPTASFQREPGLPEEIEAHPARPDVHPLPWTLTSPSFFERTRAPSLFYSATKILSFYILLAISIYEALRLVEYFDFTFLLFSPPCEQPCVGLSQAFVPFALVPATFIFLFFAPCKILRGFSLYFSKVSRACFKTRICKPKMRLLSPKYVLYVDFFSFCKDYKFTTL